MEPIINEFISEDDLQRFSDFNRGHWSRLRDGDPNVTEIPGGSRANARPLSIESRSEGFTDATTRNKQNAWLGNFTNNSSAGANAGKENPVPQEEKKDTSKQEDKTQPQGEGALTDEEATALAEEYNAQQAADAGFGA